MDVGETSSRGALPRRVLERWQGHGAAERYVGPRFASARAAARDPRLVARLLRRHGVRGPVLDVPCGSGRLAPALRGLAPTYVGADVSGAMLAAGAPMGAPRVRASVERLPFADASFDVVVCCRLLHHLDDEAALAAILRELTRVSARLVVASYWDAASLQALRRGSGLRVDASGRRAVSRSRLEAAFRAAGAELIDRAHSFRFVSQQAFAVARKRG